MIAMVACTMTSSSAISVLALAAHCIELTFLALRLQGIHT